MRLRGFNFHIPPGRFSLLTTPPVNSAKRDVRPKPFYFPPSENAFAFSEIPPRLFPNLLFTHRPKTSGRRPTHRISRPVAQFVRSASAFLIPTAIPTAKTIGPAPPMAHRASEYVRTKFRYGLSCLRIYPNPK